MSTKNTSHSVNFDGDNLIFDLIFPDNMMIQEFSESLVNSFIFQQGFSDASSNASAPLEMPLENFQDIFRIRLNSTNIAFENFEYYIDYTKWNFNTLAQSEVPFSLAIVDHYDGSLNRGPINPSHSNQSLKRDMARHVFQAIPNVQRLNNLQQFQHSIIQMIENMDGNINITDIVLLIEHIISDNSIYNSHQLFLSDLNNDTLMNVTDIILVIEKILR